MANFLHIQDDETKAFFNAAGYSNFTFNEQYAVNYLVNNLKSSGIWSKCKAIYPFVGGTASTHKWNLKDPRDLDVAYRIVWNGTITHNLFGAKGDGSTGWGNTFINGNTDLNSSNVSIGIYGDKIARAGAFDFGGGSSVNGDQSIQISLNFTSIGSLFDIFITNGTGLRTAITSNSDGYVMGQRITSTSMNLFENGNKILTKAGVVNNGIPNVNMGIFARINHPALTPSNFSSRQIKFISIGDGLTDTEAVIMSNIVYFYQRILNRA